MTKQVFTPKHSATISAATKDEIVACLARLIGTRKIAASTAIRIYPQLVRKNATNPLRAIVRIYDTRKAVS